MRKKLTLDPPAPAIDPESSNRLRDALKDGQVSRQRGELRGIQGYWTQRARERGILRERDLERYLTK